jgi:hypothetical protein
MAFRQPEKSAVKAERQEQAIGPATLRDGSLSQQRAVEPLNKSI